MFTKWYDPPLPPNFGDLFPLLVINVNESILSPLLYSIWSTYSPSGTDHTDSPPPNPPTAEVNCCVMPSLKNNWMLSSSDPDLTWTLLNYIVVELTNSSNACPPELPYYGVLAMTMCAGDGFGKSGVMGLQCNLSHSFESASSNCVTASVLLNLSSLIFSNNSLNGNSL